MHTPNLIPQIIVAQSEHRQLQSLAESGRGPLSAAADSLWSEMDRAHVVRDDELPPDVVRMGSRVQYQTDKDQQIEVVLVFPNNADISQNKVSVLTPIGAALIGLRIGQSISWQARNGRNHTLTVISVTRAIEETIVPGT